MIDNGRLLAAPDLLVALEDVPFVVKPLNEQGYHFVNKANFLIGKVKGGLNEQGVQKRSNPSGCYPKIYQRL